MNSAPLFRILLIGFVLAPIFGLLYTPQRVDAATLRSNCPDDPYVRSDSRSRYHALRELEDPGTHQRWLLVRDMDRATGPALFVRESRHSECAFFAAKEMNVTPLRGQLSSLPVIHAGDQIILSEHGINSDAELEATALDTGAAGDSLRVRIKFGGRTVRAIAATRGHATRGVEASEIRP
ncbi:hypothetical protein P8935_16480 [Telmatobacter sp. DSM 110680]|uniref:Flagella basal body P-ring formation protein FlgA n=1 Tax=Telmatobacter sp. DSM 110680 TaxID=3036704 RepID=A0AAU7DFP2_9BACT